MKKIASTIGLNNFHLFGVWRIGKADLTIMLPIIGMDKFYCQNLHRRPHEGIFMPFDTGFQI
jgi:hypothetical protein